MLEQLLAELNNWFIASDGVHVGTFEIKDGRLDLPFLLNGQYFRIMGSILNDGLYRYEAAAAPALTDETFDGAVWALAIPKDVLALADEIEAWSAQNPAAQTPFVSESFGGYSYSKATNSKGQPSGWRDVFSDRMTRYRKVREYASMPPEVGA